MTGNKIYKMTMIGLMTALLCVLGPLSFPLPGGVPLSLTHFIIYLAVYLLGGKMGTVSCVLYLAAGLCGLPVFSGYMGGVARFAGPTGGFLVGYLLSAACAGLFFEIFRGKRVPYIVGMFSGLLISYCVGTVWYMYAYKVTMWATLAACVFPFILFDILKVALVAVIGPVIRKRLSAYLH